MKTDLQTLDRILKDFTSMDLLQVLIYRNGKSEAAVKTERFVPHMETIIAIGNDFVASIVMPNDAYHALFSKEWDE